MQHSLGDSRSMSRPESLNITYISTEVKVKPVPVQHDNAQALSIII